MEKQVSANFRLSTSCLPVIETGVYGSEMEDWLLEETDIEAFHADIVNNGKYQLKSFFNDLSEKTGLQFELSNFNFHSPKFYNFENDTIEYDLKFEGKIEINDEKDFDLFLRQNYSSHPGFISFMPESIDSWKIKLEIKDWFKCLIPYIYYIALKNEILNDDEAAWETDYHDDFMEAMHETDTYFDYIDYLENDCED